MDLNNIQLNAQQLVQLYGQVLVEAPAGQQTAPVAEPVAAPAPQVTEEAAEVPEPVAEAAPEAPFIRSLGGNAGRVLVVVQKEKEAFLPEGELHFLTAILKACSLSLADIALVNLTRTEGQNYSTLTEHFGSRKVLLFDVTPVQLGMPINFPPFQVQAFKDCQYLQAPSLHLIENDLTVKKNLWAALKNLFQL